MSAWSSAATGKPQLSYAERLRKAQGNSAASTSSAAPVPKLSQLAHSAQASSPQGKEGELSSSPTTSPKASSRSVPTPTSAAPKPAPAIPNGVPLTLASAAAHEPVATPPPKPVAAVGPPVNVWEARRKAMAEKEKEKPSTVAPSGPSTVSPKAPKPADTGVAPSASKVAVPQPEANGPDGAEKGKGRAPATSASPSSKSQPQAAPQHKDSAKAPVAAPADVAAARAPAESTGPKTDMPAPDAAPAVPSQSVVAAAAPPLADNSWLDRIQMLNGGRTVPTFDGASPASPASPTGAGLATASSTQGAVPTSSGQGDSASASIDSTPAGRTSMPNGAGELQSTQGHGRRKSSTSRPSGRGRKASTSERRQKQQGQADERQLPSLEDPSLWPSPIAAASTLSSRPKATSSTRQDDSQPADIESKAEDATRDTEEPVKALEGLQVKLARPIDAAKASKKGGKQWIPIVPTITHTSPLPPRDKRPSQSGDREAAPRRQSRSNASNGGPSNRRPSKSQGSGARPDRQERESGKAGESSRTNGDAAPSEKARAPRESSGAPASAPAEAVERASDDLQGATATSKPSGAGSSKHTSTSSTPAHRSIDASRPAHLPATPPKAATPPPALALDPTAASFGAGMPVMRLGAMQPRSPQPRPHTDGSFSPTRRQYAPTNGDDARGPAGNLSRGARGPGRGRGRGSGRGSGAGSLPGSGPRFEGGDLAPYPSGPYPPLVYADGFYAYAPYPPGSPAGQWPVPIRAPPGSGAPFVPGMPVPVAEFSSPSPSMSNGGPTHQLLTQIEFYFSHRNLEGDFFLRQCMDEQGWVAIERVASFKRVKSITEDINVVRDTLLYSTVLQVDVPGSRVRKAFGWEQYILPGAAKHVPSEGSIAAANAGNAAALAAAAAAAATGIQPSPAHSHRSTSTNAAPSSSVPDRLHPSAGPAGATDGASGSGHDGQSSSTQLTESNVSKSSTAFSSPPSSFGRAASQSGDDSRDARGLALDDDDDDRDDDDDDDEETLGVVAAEGLGGALSTKTM